MRQPALVQELDRVAGLVDDVPDLVQRVRVVVVVFLENVKKSFNVQTYWYLCNSVTR